MEMNCATFACALGSAPLNAWKNCRKLTVEETVTGLPSTVVGNLAASAGSPLVSKLGNAKLGIAKLPPSGGMVGISIPDGMLSDGITIDGIAPDGTLIAGTVGSELAAGPLPPHAAATR